MASTLTHSAHTAIPPSSYSPQPLPAPARDSSASRPPSTLNQAHQPPPPFDTHAASSGQWGRVGELHTEGENRPGALSGQEAGQAEHAAPPRGFEPSHGQHASGSFGGRVGAAPSDPSSLSSMGGAGFPSSTAQSHSRRPTSAESSASSSHLPPLMGHHQHHLSPSLSHSQSHSLSSSPHSRTSTQAYTASQPSSTLGVDAFDYDDLLGPRPGARIAGSTGSRAGALSVSPPTSSASEGAGPGAGGEAEKRTGSRLQGLGFVRREESAETAGRSRWSSHATGGTAGEPADGEEEDDDAAWLHHRLAASSVLPTPPTSSPPAPAPQTIGGRGSRQASANPTSTVVGSPLSPLVAPFSPANLPGSGTVGRAGGSPWAVQAQGGVVQAGSRERETSWNPSLTAAASAYPSPPSRADRSREPTAPLFSPPPSHQASFAPAQQQQGSPFSFPLAPQMSPTPSHQLQHQRDDSAPHFPPFLPHPHARGMSKERLAFPSSSALESAPSGPLGFPSSSTQPSLPPALAPGEDLSTIFVVGFPDDFTAREFELLFTFADGFEGAALKVPPATVAMRELEREVGAAVVAAAVSAGGSENGSSGGGGEKEEKDREQQERASASAIPPHLAAATSVPAPSSGASTPLSTSGAVSLNSSTSTSAAARKQIIGFARFSTRPQAEEAIEVLTGRKVDGRELKAEMAKKNLHARRSFPSENGSVTAGTRPGTSTGVLVGTPALPAISTGAPPASTLAAGAGTVASPTSAAATTLPPGTGPSIPLSALDASTRTKIANLGSVNPAVLAEIARQSMAAAAASAAAQAAAQQGPPPVGGPSEFGDQAAWEAFHSVPSMPPSHLAGGGAPPLLSPRRDFYGPGLGLDDGLSGAGGGGYGHPLSPNMSDTSSISPPLAGGPLSAYAAAGRGLLPHQQHAAQQAAQQQQQQQVDELLLLRGGIDPALLATAGLRSREPSFPASLGGVGGVGGVGGGSVPFPPGPTPRQQALLAQQQQGQQAQQAQQQMPQSPPLGFAPGLGVIPRTQNPADMNAPKNTLYVGGLPAVLPSLTGPFSASHLEDSLRNAFSRCPGFKRLQFRSKSNGPIVFVEFVDTAYATRAMQELYGHTLGGLVKGGIRLSYSKNPLGVRSNGLPSGNPPPGLDPLGVPPSLAGPASGGGFARPSLPPLGGVGVGPPLGPPAGPVRAAFDLLPYDPHRRPPDPIYGEPPQVGFLPLSPPLPPQQHGGNGNGNGSTGTGTASATSLTPQLAALSR
ncbi:hypothetical protein JCM8097_007564, partial [Rhodosporidiobolus ruineniae]